MGPSIKVSAFLGPKGEPAQPIRLILQESHLGERPKVRTDSLWWPCAEGMAGQILPPRSPERLLPALCKTMLFQSTPETCQWFIFQSKLPRTGFFSLLPHGRTRKNLVCGGIMFTKHPSGLARQEAHPLGTSPWHLFTYYFDPVTHLTANRKKTFWRWETYHKQEVLDPTGHNWLWSLTQLIRIPVEAVGAETCLGCVVSCSTSKVISIFTSFLLTWNVFLNRREMDAVVTVLYFVLQIFNPVLNRPCTQ